MKDLFSGKEIEFDGRPVRLKRALRNIPIHLAATGPKMLRLAGAVADGVIIQVGFHPGPMAFAIEQVRQGAEEAGRPFDEIEIICSAFTSIHRDRALAVRRIKPVVAWLYAAAPHALDLAGVSYSRRLPGRPIYPDISHPYDHEDAMREAETFVSDEAADKLALVGTPEEAVDRLKALAAEVRIDRFFLRNFPTFELPRDLVRDMSEVVIPGFRR